ncbi:LacI family DNA-binding transcriptional regulator [Parapedobacter indicus]|uniref:Transcriptional regulator, LacI family n=1 Tax=Parapedobacter indicus TaxID=1477437 RepID=A0A1I3RXT7_9SPHI|nr:LacI family DNA-binding transcriptional regulator [Parapedobacter indicus]PPK99939.1 LacI family transcriptional regulator [Parapedobacter indicus]SFJ51148.1 transcriptional regulator, LacI family [Parapedobacter indicus]
MSTATHTKQPTIVDIAVRLNLSISTVSRALRNAPDVNTHTKKAVLAMAEKIGYEPNTVAASLRNNKTNIIGIIVPEFVHVYFPSVILGVQDVVNKAGYKLMICQSSESFDLEKKNLQALVSSRVDGLIMALSRETDHYKHIKKVQEKTPIVFFNRITDEISGSKVLVDDYGGAYEAVKHLIEVGCRRIAHISGPKNLTMCESRLQGYLDALNHYQIPINENYILHADFVDDKARECTQQLIAMDDKPDAIFAVNDPTAIEALICIKQNGLNIPDDIALVGFSNAPHSAFVDPPLTSVVQPTFQIGQVAANLLLEHIEKGEDYRPEIRVLETSLIIRNSTNKTLSTLTDINY